MKNYLPMQLKLSWKNRFYSYPSKYLLTKIENHQQSILVACRRQTSPLLTRLDAEEFWVKLKALCSDKNKVENIHVLWKQIKPLAHLNSAQLLSLLQDEILPLEKLYRSTLLQLISNSKKYRETISHFQNNLKNLNRLRDIVFDGLLLRCKAYKQLKVQRNVDDCVASLANKINELNLLDKELNIPKDLSATLDDDRRFTIYDLLKGRPLDKNTLLQEVLLSVPKRSHTAIRPAHEIKKDLEDIQLLNNRVIIRLESDQNDDSKPTYFGFNIIPAFLVWTANKTASSIRNALSYIGITSFFEKIWNIRYAIYLSLSLSTYYFILQIATPWIYSLFGVAAFSTISSVLFCTLGIAPLWWLGLKGSIALGKGIKNYLTHWKKEEILEALIVLDNTQTFICGRLSQSIIDIPHFDIQHLAQTAQRYEKQLEQSEFKLKRFYVGERILCKGGVSTQLEVVQSKINSQQKQIQTQLKHLTIHIAKRIGQEIELLDKHANKHVLAPILPSEQLEKLEQFVITFGDNKTLTLFKNNSNVIEKWLKKIEKFKFLQARPEDVNYHQPWGGHDIHRDLAKGWHVILNAFARNAPSRDACLQLNQLLLGDRTMTEHELHNLVKKLDVGNRVAFVIQKIQSHLFNTLQARSPQCARLLSRQQKNIITQWYHKHEIQIKTAEKVMSQIFSKSKYGNDQLTQKLDEIGDDTLASYYELLDGADIYCYSANQVESISKRKNLARQYFEENKGDSSLAYRFIKFIPQQEKGTILIDVAKKRLGWLLEHLDKRVKPAKPFDEVDIELFNDFELLEQNDKFAFSRFVRQSKYFDAPWTQNMETFLDSCRKCGFDTGGLLKSYREKNNRVKSFILHQHNERKNSPQCKSVAKYASTHSLDTVIRSRKRV